MPAKMGDVSRSNQELYKAPFYVKCVESELQKNCLDMWHKNRDTVYWHVIFPILFQT